LWKDKHLAMWVCGFITGCLLVVVDELITLSLYCGRGCDYAFPFLGAFDIYSAWTLVFIGIFVAVFASLLVLNSDKS
jgi:hypothetical protein